VIALELYTAAQALDFRQEMLNAARRLAARGDWQALASKVANAPREDHPQHAQFAGEVRELVSALAHAGDFHAGVAVRRAHDELRRHIGFMHRDRAMDGDVRKVCELVRERALRPD
jgi:histidine ammonia-lyase